MYMTPTHTRNIRYRNLYRAVPIVEKQEKLSAWEKETRNMVDKAYRRFWKKRGIKAPWVSADQVGLLEKAERNR